MKFLFKALAITILIMGNNSLLNCQINDKLRTICDEIRIINDTSDPNYSQLIRSREYDMQIENDTLFVNLTEKTKDNHQRVDVKGDSIVSNFFYKANINDIGKITFNSKLITLFGNSHHESKIEIESLQSYNLFDIQYDNGNSRKTWRIPIHIIKQSDTTKFKRLVSLLNGYINTEENSGEANCKFDKIHEISGKPINAIDNINLATQIQLNGRDCGEKELEHILASYLEEQNIKNLLGYFVINSLDKLESLWCEQNDLHKFVNSVDKLPIGYSTIVKSLGTIDDKQMADLFQILEQQDWNTGACNGENVDSYFDFIIENPKYKESGDDNK